MNDNPPKLLITGGLGFIGSHVHEAYPHADILDLKNGQDILDRVLMKNLLPQYDRVIHLAALISGPESIKRPMAYWDTNFFGTKNVCRYAKKVLFASSAAAIKPINPYGYTKKACEKIVIDASGCVARFFNVFGERQVGGVVPTFIRAAIHDQPIHIHGDGKQIRDFIYVKDLVAAFSFDMELMEIGSCIPIRIIDLAHLIKEICNSNSKIIHGPALEGDVDYSCSHQFRNYPYGFYAGLIKTIHHYQNE